MLAGRAIASSNQWSGGDKTMSAWSVGAVLGAWQIGGISIVGAAQNGYTIGIAGAWYSIAGAMYFIVIALLAKPIRELMPGDSVPNYLTKRYSSKSGRLYSYIWLGLGLLYIPIQLKTIASLIQMVLPQFNANMAMVIGLVIAALYTGYAGMKGSAIIGKIVCIGTYALLIWFVVTKLPKFGGYSGLVSQLPENFGSMGNMPTQRIIAWIIGGILSTIVMQSVLQPVLAAKDVTSARVGSLIGYVIAGPICIITAMIGMMGRATTAELGNGATAFAWTLKHYSSPLIAGIVFAVSTMIIAATLATMMMAQGTVIKNIYSTQIRPGADDKSVLRVSRYGTFIFAFITLIPAFLIPSAQLTNMFLTLLYVATGPVSFSIFAGLLWKRTPPAASFWSMLLGVITGILWVVTGMVQKLDTIYPIIAVSYTTGIILTLASKKPAAAE
ncbi:MAG: sodium:solute symporter family protein [Spirochaetaceae bacterium]|jgi:Na+/proline symporter|nr:sodium:solute symporter family protein [Spirochaetaceae bacterium]